MTVALPTGSTATWGSHPSWSEAERPTGVVQLPPAARVEDVTIQPELSWRCQTAVVVPWRSTASCGVSKTSPVDRSTGAVHAPPLGRDAVWTPYAPPLKLPQIAVAVPAGSTTTRGLARGPATVDRSTGAAHVPPAGRVAAWTTAPATHVAVALPAGSTATSVIRAELPAAERSTGVVQVPSARRVADWAVCLLASKRDQETVTVPAASTSTCGKSGRWVGSTVESDERSTGEPHAPPAGRYVAWTTLRSVSTRRHTAVALPAGSTAICGL